MIMARTMPKISLAPFQVVALKQNFEHFAFLAGVAAGKTFTGSHWAIDRIQERPELTGLLGANTYDQLNQATLREFMYWLEQYGYEYVVDACPPDSWNQPRRFKKHSNILTVRAPWSGKCTTIFTRILSKGNPLRGIEFSWYWIDESRDTPENTHDVILSRMREDSSYRKGLITTTTNGEDWVYNRIVKGRKQGSNRFGSMHVPTIEAVKAGIISQDFYDTMLASYSPIMAQQELMALHVNPFGGRAYYSSGNYNRLPISPWGDLHPNPNRPLVVGCDFNFSPAPCVWIVGQTGPDMYGPNGEYWADYIHWFAEISGVEKSTVDMTVDLINQYPGFFFRIYGDASGDVGTTSNAGETDYYQMSGVFDENGIGYTTDIEQRNPLVRDRVENMNRMFIDGVGVSRQTYSPSGCPLLDGDTRIVGWKQTILKGRGKLDDRGDKKRTHASDAAGYAVFKLFPPSRRARIIESAPSLVRAEYGLAN